jgi:hypothetical protein
MHFEDGTKYEGGWKNDKKHGEGTFTDIYGKSKIRIWRKGIKLDKDDMFSVEELAYSKSVKINQNILSGVRNMKDSESLGGNI